MPEMFRDILRPELDDREYAVFTLPNKLEVLLISDPKTDKAAAAMDVHVGHLTDPEEVAGLAHFLEHMLFMGSERYPGENQYSEFLSAHGGSSNAFTGTENTNYYFDVAPEHLEAAFDIFIQFFISPLFAEGSTDREMRAVDSENKKNLQLDAWRLYQLQKDHSVKGHPFGKFGTGNLETLLDGPKSMGLNIREMLLNWYATNYSASIMKMAVLGREPIEKLAEWVVEKAAAIKNTDGQPPTYPGHPLSGDALGQQLLVKPVKDMRDLELSFPFPDLTSKYRSQPAGYISHLVGHESDGSILALLKKKGWAQSLNAGYSTAAANFGFFTISISLTDEGFQNHEEIVAIVFQYLEMLRKSGVQRWIFDEIQTMANISFRFREKSNPSSFVSRVAGLMQKYPREHILSGSAVVHDFDAKAIEEALSLLRPDNFRMTIVSPLFDTTGWSRARVYGTEYLAEPIPSKLKDRLSSLTPNLDLFLPLKNEFVPKSLEVRKVTTAGWVEPKITIETPTMRLWFKKDDTFHVPKAKASFLFKSPLAYATPYMSVLSRLYVDILEDDLNAFSYYASVAGLQYSLSATTEGVDLSIFGYNSEIHSLLSKIVHTMKHVVIKPGRFNAIKEELERNYRNWKFEAPHSHASYFASFATQERLWTTDEKLDALSSIEEDDVVVFGRQFLSALHVEGLVMGNMDVADAEELVAAIESHLAPRPLPIVARELSSRTLLLPYGSHFVHEYNVPNPDQLNSAIEWNAQIGDIMDDDLRIRCMLLAQIAREPCFNTLRTQEQLGYIVFSGLRKMTGLVGFRVIVQSERAPAYVEQRIEAFLSSLREMIVTMPDEIFAKNRSALAHRLSEKSKNLYEESSKMWGSVQSQYYEFDQQVRDAERLAQVSKTDIISFYDEYLSVSSLKRRILSIHMVAKAVSSHPDSVAQLEVKDVARSIDEVSAWRNRMSMGPGATPLRPLRSYFAEGARVILSPTPKI